MLFVPKERKEEEEETKENKSKAEKDPRSSLGNIEMHRSILIYFLKILL